MIMKTNVLILALLMSFAVIIKADGSEEIRHLFGSLQIGEETNPDRNKSWMEKALSDIEKNAKLNDWNQVLVLTEDVLKQFPTQVTAVRFQRQAKRELFWRKYGDWFILGLILVVVIPSGLR
ncbi:MAG: hypothetical protein PHQ23_12460, partial [Candidatus Wallbacteria bacterium]|nr:hypothetical protein [Candidatus Wallbacteria bacterium]